MLCWILAIYDVDAVLFCERKVQYVYSNVYERSRLYETRDSLDVENFELGLDERKP